MYYDMSGFDYGILDVVQVLHLGRLRKNNITQYNMKIKQAILHSSSVFDI